MYQDFFVPGGDSALLIADLDSVSEALEDDDQWDNAVAAATLFPYGLYAEIGVGLRVRDDKLTEPEADGWLGKTRWKLSIPSGRLVVACGLDALLDAADDAYDGNSVGVPAGDYTATLHTMVTGANAPHCLMQADGVEWENSQKFGSWWRQTRAKQQFPDWLRAFCMTDPAQDPKHRREWEALDQDEADYLASLWEDRPWADYVMLLEPLDEALEMPELDDGLLCETEVRRTERCPEAIELD